MQGNRAVGANPINQTPRASHETYELETSEDQPLQGHQPPDPTSSKFRAMFVAGLALGSGFAALLANFPIIELCVRPPLVNGTYPNYEECDTLTMGNITLAYGIPMVLLVGAPLLAYATTQQVY